MYSNVQRDAGYISKLIGFIRQEYGIEAAAILPAKRGYYGETWRMEAVGRSYIIKVDYSQMHQHIYARSFAVIEHLCNQGIDFISRIVKTADGRLFTRFEDAVLGIFDWIDGENIENDNTKIPEFDMLAKVYTVPAEGLDIPQEDFLGSRADRFFEQWDRLQHPQLASILEKHRDELEHRVARLRHFAALCSCDSSGFVITHGDAGGNLLVNGDRAYIIDWDDPMLAPPERDAWNMVCCGEWAKDSFHKALRRHGFDYILRPERVAYYVYQSFFLYLTEHLDEFLQTGIVPDLEAYFSGWVEERIAFAEQHL